MSRSYPIAISVCILAATSNYLVGQSYVVTDLGVLNGHVGSVANGLNDVGQVVGQSFRVDGVTEAITWSNGRLTGLGNLGGDVSRAYAINNSGAIVGDSLVNNVETNRWNPFVYRNGSMLNLAGVIGASTGQAIDINNAGDIVGWTEFGSVQRAFVTKGGIPTPLPHPEYGHAVVAMATNNTGQVVGTGSYPYFGSSGLLWSLASGDVSSGLPNSVRDINDYGVVAGYSSSWIPNSPVPHRATTYDTKTGNWIELGNLGGTHSHANGINNAGIVVGYSDAADGSQRGFVYRNGTMTDLNTLIPATAGWTINEANAINSKAQIVGRASRNGQTRAVMLTPTNQAPRNYAQLAPAPTSPVDTPQRLTDELGRRFERWDSSSKRFVAISQDEIRATTPVVVLTHGWGKGMRDEVDSYPGAKAWELNRDGESEAWGAWMGDLAESVQAKNPGAVVLGFNWLDYSATEDLVDDLPRELMLSRYSRAATTPMGLRLGKTLLPALLPDDYMGEISLIGHSHGSRVVAKAALELKLAGRNVDRLTLLDSPESFSADWGGATNDLGAPGDILDQIAATNSGHGIGNANGQIFVDSYSSAFGRAYYQENLVNVALQGKPLSGLEAWHSYPYDWLRRSGSSSATLGLNWNRDNSPATLFWKQDWWFGLGEIAVDEEFMLVVDSAEVRTAASLRQPDTFVYSLTGSANSTVPGFLHLEENSPAFADMTLVTIEGDTTLQFSYRFLNVGDGDQLGVWIDDELFLVTTGWDAGLGVNFESISLVGVDPGLHLVTIALHSYGDSNASFEIGDFRIVNVPEPTAIGSIFAGAIMLISTRRRPMVAKRRQAS